MVRNKEANRKAEQDEVAQRPTKAQCEGPNASSSTEVEGGWELEYEQLKAFWACFPLLATPLVSDKVQTGTHGNLMPEGDRAEAADAKDTGMKDDDSHTRKHFIKAVRNSIDEQVKVDAKRRRCHQAEFDPRNSMEDHIKPNREIKVEVLKHDLQGNRIRKTGIASDRQHHQCREAPMMEPDRMW